MSSAIHIELDALCLLMLCSIVYQSRKNFNQQMSRILFRRLAYGIIGQLILDILWILIEGRLFPGAIFLNRLINALYLGIGVCLGCIWYLYALETLGYTITRRLQTLMMLPGLFFTLLNLASVWTGWVFTVSPENVYAHSSLYWLQTIGAYGMLLASFAHILVYLLCRRDSAVSRHDIQKLLIFYVVTVVGSFVSLLETGMPGTWTCAAISVVLIYLDDQNREILNGMISAMAADYRSIYYADLDRDSCVCVRAAAASNEKEREGSAFSFRKGFAQYAEDCVAEPDRESFLRFLDPENIRAGLAGGAMLSHRYRTGKNGAEAYEMLSIAGVRTLKDREGSPVHAIGVGFSDVDRQMREELEHKRALTEALARAEEASAAKTAFLSSMSHEMRTPMNAIIGLDSIALRDPGISPSTRDELEKIGASARHLLDLINDILDMNQVESGRMTLREEAFSLPETLRQVDTVIGCRCRDKGLCYESRVLGRLDERFVGDGLRLRQVILSILGNAVKFTDAPGTVRFTAEQLAAEGEDALLRFTMQDTGIGMDAAFLPRLFETFSQEDSTTTNRYGGSGLGLALTKRIVDLMGGTIAVETEKGRGTTFTVELPLRRAQPDQPTDAQAQAGPDAGVAGLHVLIAEDQEMNAEILTELLEMEEVSSEWAENGQRAVELFAQSEVGHFDAILMDMRMPVMDGLTATREIRKLDRPDAAAIPIIALTANAFEEDVRQCLEAGMNVHLAKPVDIDLLTQILGREVAER